LAGAEIEKAVAAAKQVNMKGENVETAISFGSLTAISSKNSSLENQTA
jgi:hypothetical protein